MWFSSRYVNAESPINLIALLQRVKWNASEERTYEDFLALGAIGEDELSLKEKMREWES